MKLGSITSLPNEFTRYGKITDSRGNQFTVEENEIPKDAEIGSQYAYSVEIWENDSGIAYDLKEE